MPIKIDQTREQLSEIFTQQGISKAHLKPFMQRLNKGTKHLLKNLDGFPAKLKELGSQINYFEPKIISMEISPSDSSHKFILELQDKKEIEAVLIPEKNRLTLCLSSQVGCAQKCVFCYTGKMGLVRNLTCEEILSQVITVNQWLHENKAFGNKLPTVNNIVFMGMGEPLDNTEALLPALSLLKDPFAFNLAPKRITVSTAGHLKGLRELINADFGTSLALSLHSPSSSLRERIMPITKENPISEVLSEMEQYALKRKREIFIQYTLFEGVNDKEEHANQLIDLFKNRPFKINLIPFNEVSFSRLKRPEDNSVRKFQDWLIKGGIRTTVRFSKGRDIKAACGQLVRKEKVA